MHVKSNYLSLLSITFRRPRTSPTTPPSLAPQTVTVDPNGSTSGTFALKITRPLTPTGQRALPAQYMTIAFSFLDENGLSRSTTDFVD